MTDAPPAAARTSPSTARNRQPIMDVLAPRLPSGARVLEVASGAGEHAVFLAAAMPRVIWQPSDRDPEALASIAAWCEADGPPNLSPPVRLDAADLATWPDGPFEAVVCINMIHISPWEATRGLVAGAGHVLAPGGLLFLYGPYVEAGVETAPSNLAFDENLKSRNPAWGIRRLEAVAAEAARNGLALAERVSMPANNLAVFFRRV